MNDLIKSGFISAFIIGIIGFIGMLLRKGIIESVVKSISYSFDKKLQENKKQIDIELKIIESQLSSNSIQVESLINNNLAALDFSRQKQIDAVEILWTEMMKLRQAIPGFVFTLESMPSNLHDEMIQSMDLKKIIEEFSLSEFVRIYEDSKVRNVRLFSGELLYSQFTLKELWFG